MTKNQWHMSLTVSLAFRDHIHNTFISSYGLIYLHVWDLVYLCNNWFEGSTNLYSWFSQFLLLFYFYNYCHMKILYWLILACTIFIFSLSDAMCASCRWGKKMPALVVFNRRWRIGSDDLVIPGIIEVILRAVWWGSLFTFLWFYNYNCCIVLVLHN